MKTLIHITLYPYPIVQSQIAPMNNGFLESRHCARAKLTKNKQNSQTDFKKRYKTDKLIKEKNKTNKLTN